MERVKSIGERIEDLLAESGATRVGDEYYWRGQTFQTFLELAKAVAEAEKFPPSPDRFISSESGLDRTRGELVDCACCGKSISNRAPSCPICGEPNALLCDAGSQTNKQSVPITPTAMTPATEGNVIGQTQTSAFVAETIGGVLGLFFVIVFTIKACSPDSAPSTPKMTDNSSMAFIQCKEFVKERLKAPATADFPFLDFSSRKVTDNHYIIQSYVDAQNGFGAKLRNNYFCEVEWNGHDENDRRNWTLVALKLTE